MFTIITLSFQIKGITLIIVDPDPLRAVRFGPTMIHYGESKTQRKWFLDEKRDGLVDENRANNKENKNNKAVFMLYLFAYNIKPMPK